MDSEPQSPADQQFLAAEYKVELHSAGLKKELRLVDLVGIQILNTMGFAWVGTAGKLGSSHLMFWILGVTLFYIPSGIVVAHLATQMPLEGGLYQWAKLRFSPLVGFLVAMNIWIANLLLVSRAGVVTADNTSYALGPGSAWISTSRLAIIGLSVCVVAGVTLIGWRGLALGKWVNNFGGFAIVFLFAAMIAVAFPHWFNGTVAIAPVAFTFPPVSLFSLNILGKLGYGALAGFDAVGVFAGECRSEDASGPIRRSVWLAAPLISGLFILGTACVLVFSKPETIDLVSPMTQVLNLGAPRLATPSALLLVAALLAQTALGFSVMVRLPMVAGWDHLLPRWFSRLDPRFGTPVGSVLFAGVVGVVFAILANLGTGNQEAFQLLDNASGILYALAYLAMFAIPLVARGDKPFWGVRVAALSGFLMTLLYVVLSVFPIIDLRNPGLFTAKIVTTVCVLQALGAAFYWRATRRTRV